MFALASRTKSIEVPWKVIKVHFQSFDIKGVREDQPVWFLKKHN